MSEQAKAKHAAPAATATKAATPAIPFEYSNRVILKAVLESGDGGLGLVGRRFVIGGWVKSSKEVRKESVAPSKVDVVARETDQSLDVSCSEILQSRIPFIRSIIKILGGSNYSVREKLEPVIAPPRPPPPSVAFLQVSDGSCASSLQVVVDSSIAIPGHILPTGTCIVAEGELKQPSVEGKHVIELKVEKVLHIGRVEPDKYPLSKKRLPLNLLRDCPHFRPRTTTVASVMRIRSALTFAAHTFSQNRGFLCVQVPVITTTDSEGFSKTFKVTTVLEDEEVVSLEVVKAAMREKKKIVEDLKRTDSNQEALDVAIQDLEKTTDLASQLEAREKHSKSKSSSIKADKKPQEFFSRQAHLTVSGRLHLESYACSLGNVYAFGPRFSASKVESPKHIAEMWTVEIEMAFSQLEDAMKCAEDFFKFLCKWVLEKCSSDMQFVLKRIDRTIIDRLQSVISISFERISYTEALDALKKANKKVETTLEWGTALTAEHLSFLAEEIYKKAVVVYNYPKQVKPFYVRLNDDGQTVAAFDLVVPKVGTLISGSQNEERFDMLSARIKELGLVGEEYEWYLDLRRHGTVKHAGFSFGFDLMVLFATGLADVRDVIPFPRTHGKISN
ncbi:Asparagine--tRNA ligase, cytoplasmic 2 [Morus notabilis]|uniref:asparagine--tRNA ligase n=1 Tax=Morus notabilis TaxID=981085 RepID=W9S2Q6_9ROSA|nr:Asparagine--tRNA ligase, cytoplasmic 2 [Morus notabilis]